MKHQAGMRSMIALFAIICLAGPAGASSLEWEEDAEFRAAVKAISKVIKAKSMVLKISEPTLKFPKVDTEDSLLPGGSELGIELALRRLLESEKIALAEAAPLGLRVTYKISTEPKQDEPEKFLPVLLLEFSVLEPSREGTNRYRYKIHRTGLILAAGEKTAQLITPSKPQSAENHEAKVQEVLAGPSDAAVAGSQVLAKADDPFSLEVLVDRKPAEPKLSQGKNAYIELQKGQNFTIVLRNRSPKNEAVASVLIDGIDICQFSKERETTGVNKGKLAFRPLWVVPAKGQTEIRGWHITHEQFDQFLVTEKKDSARALLGYNGMHDHCITATFCRCWKKGEEPPADEPSGGMGQEDIGIGRGARVAGHTEVVERVVGREHSVITLRYRSAEK